MAQKATVKVPADGSKPEAVATEEPLVGSSGHSQSSGEEQVPHLHAKTFLAVFAVCLIYFAQVVSLVGAGAVSLCLCSSSHAVNPQGIANTCKNNSKGKSSQGISTALPMLSGFRPR